MSEGTVPNGGSDRHPYREFHPGDRHGPQGSRRDRVRADRPQALGEVRANEWHTNEEEERREWW